MAGIQYSIRKNRLDKALYKGMEVDAAGKIRCSENTDTHYFILPIIDSGIEDCGWGRIQFSLDLPQDSVCYLYAAASNEKAGVDLMMDANVGIMEKKRFLSSLTCLRFINKPDVLLYEIEGRYLWVCVEVIGQGITIENMIIQAPGDNFMQLFPEVYREKNSFFHRYLSIFSSLYQDMNDVIEHRENLLDMDKAPKKLIELYIRWLGIDIDGGFLEENVLRKLLKEAEFLIKYKGTKKCVERICELVIEECPIIVERGIMDRYVKSQDQEVYNTLYGNSPYDVTLLINTVVEEQRKEQLLHLLRQFKPVRSRLHIVFLENRGILDGHSYLDENAVTFIQDDGSLDIAQVLDGTVILQ